VSGKPLGVSNTMLLKFSEYPPHLHFTIPALAVASIMSLLVGLWFATRGANMRHRQSAAAFCFTLAIVAGGLWLISVWIPEMIW
jgi:hypothetical protein